MDTLRELFEGNQSLFVGLAAHDHWDWSVRYPVGMLDFAGGDFQHPDALRSGSERQLRALEGAAQLERGSELAVDRLHDLIAGLHDQTCPRVVVLVDKYDKPILDALKSPSWPGPSATTCAGCMRSSRRATAIFASAFSRE